jgi:adenylylsulfate kinase-like enzyme
VDFSEEGRKRQARRMADFAKKIKRGRKFCL